MAYKNHEDQLAYHRNLRATRRAEWMTKNGPCRKCGSWDSLQLDHINPADKITNNVWQWRKERREAELAKCQPLCKLCHLDKTRAEYDAMPKVHGSAGGAARGCYCAQCLVYRKRKLEKDNDARRKRKALTVHSPMVRQTYQTHPCKHGGHMREAHLMPLRRKGTSTEG